MPPKDDPGSNGSNDFVKKLYQMLSEDRYSDVVRWTPHGTSFVVLNTNEFTKVILPTHFKHSNFASFVRQLNKYDFHKVKISPEERLTYAYGDDAWEFQHPEFKKNDRDALENIRRKAPTKKEPAPDASQLQTQVQQLSAETQKLASELRVANEKLRAVSESVMAHRTYNERQYRSMGALVHCLGQAGIKIPPLDFPNPNLISMVQPPAPRERDKHQHQTLQNHQSHQNHQSRQAHPNHQGHANHANHSKVHLGPMAQSQMAQGLAMGQHSRQTSQSRQQSGEAAGAVSGAGSAVAAGPSFDPAAVSTTTVPNAKFHVLLVEDDNVCIQLCRKFLMKYGCQVTVVTDGLNAISTVEHTKYDLVLMDIVMPNLDGATATSIIRSFDTKTPIIAMTGNIQDNDLVTYLQNGMSDILAKPFTKDDLYSILSKYLLGPKSEFLDSPPVPEFGSMPSLEGAPSQVAMTPQISRLAHTPPMGGNLMDPMEQMEPAPKKSRMH